jgi:zinc D-Ala-D-Ala carboxypeptidase
MLLYFPLFPGNGGALVFEKNELLGKFEASGHSDFKRVPAKYASHNNHYLRKEVVDAFTQMAKAAEKDGINLQVVSAFRSYYRQKTIWNNKYNRYEGTPIERAKSILRYSSMPGTSRHHWGTDFDINSVEPAYFESGTGKAIYEWMNKNAHKYGFFQPYNTFNNWRDKGYYEEKWHWSYFPVAEKISLAYRWMISYDDIDGFSGCEVAAKMEYSYRGSGLMVVGLSAGNQKINTRIYPQDTVPAVWY